MHVANGDGESDGGFDLQKGRQPTTAAYNDNVRLADSVRHVNDIPLLLRLPERYSGARNKPLHFLFSTTIPLRRTPAEAMLYAATELDCSAREREKYRNLPP